MPLLTLSLLFTSPILPGVDRLEEVLINGREK